MPTTLYASPFACSMATHIALEEEGQPYDVVWVDLASRRSRDGRALKDINPKNRVAALQDGERVITENPAILLYIAERSGWQGDRIALVEALCFVATEIHKQVLSLHYDPQAPEAARTFAKEQRLPAVLAHCQRLLERKPHLVGDSVSVADHFLFWALWLLKQAKVGLPAPLFAFLTRHAARPAVERVLARETAAYKEQGDL